MVAAAPLHGSGGRPGFMPMFHQQFANVPDPRVRARSDHKLLDIIAISILATVCGADGWDEIAGFGQLKKEWLGTFLELPAGIPSADTFRRVLSAIDPGAFRLAFVAWMEALVGSTEGKLVAIDGKTVRRSFDRANEKSALHLVSAWVRDNQLALGQLATEEKSNEITAIPTLLAMLDVRGAIVTIDAMGAQKEIAKTIIDKQADYILALKGNQGNLHAQVGEFFKDAGTEQFEGVKHTFHETHDEAHGRREVRRTWTSTDLSTVPDASKWPSLKSITMVERTRELGGKTEMERHYYISSRSRAGARWLSERIRGHWSIENQCHWVLDVAFREDESRIHSDHGPENFGLLRKIALNLLKQEKGCKMGIAAKRKFSGWDQDYLLKVLSGEVITV
jgi:predicted transposase YbfD/YdcC